MYAGIISKTEISMGTSMLLKICFKTTRSSCPRADSRRRRNINELLRHYFNECFNELKRYTTKSIDKVFKLSSASCEVERKFGNITFYEIGCQFIPYGHILQHCVLALRFF